jgi:hypothetical protein
MCDLARQAETLKPELMAAMERVLTSGHYILGPEVGPLSRRWRPTSV